MRVAIRPTLAPPSDCWGRLLFVRGLIALRVLLYTLIMNCQYCGATENLYLNKKRVKKDGTETLYYKCKTCNTRQVNRYRNTVKGKVAHKKAINTYINKNPDRYAQYHRTYQKNRYNKLKDDPQFKSDRRRKSKEYAIRNKGKVNARQAVHYAIKIGRIIRPEDCEQCGKTVRTYAHHHKGYSTLHRLDVIHLCRSCHVRIHKEPLL